jgi:cytochrome c oxidase cbb3-type subunit 1
MSVTFSPTQSISSEPNSPEATQANAEASCRLPVLFLFGSGILWLFVGSLMGLIASLKFHAPGLLADNAFFTYGRVQAAQTSSLLYGFGVQAALGVSLWLLCRLGRAPLAEPRVAALAAVFWNFGVALGVLGILGGDSSGFESFEMPHYAAPILFFAYLIIGLCAIVTFHNRRERQLYPSQWFILAALFWFAWIYSTASMLLLFTPVRGVLQSSINWWFAHNLSSIFFTFAGLASIFYFIPKLLGRQLHSYYLALFAFWTLALFGSWGGIPGGAPLPAWIVSLSVVGTVLTTVPVLAIATNFYLTARNDLKALDANPILRFTYIGLFFWLIVSAQKIIGALPTVSTLTDFTFFTAAQKQLGFYGFFVMTMLGAIYYIAPRLAQRDWFCTKPIRANFWLTFIGVMISYLSLLVGGIAQGLLLSNPSNSILVVMKTTLMPLRISTLGDLIIVLGQIPLLINFAVLLVRCCCCKNKTCDKQTSEVCA